MICVVNYGVANIGSMLNMLRKLGLEAKPVSSPQELEQATKVILPGVGAFDHGMKALHSAGFVEPLRDAVLRDRTPLLGVCLGMQMLGTGSDEGTSAGLGLVTGRCRRFPSRDEVPGLKVPHMGWNEISVKRESPILDGLSRARFYFVHSYHFVCEDDSAIAATAEHGIEFCAVVQSAHVWGVQFHPEKSHRFGMQLLANFGGI